MAKGIPTAPKTPKKKPGKATHTSSFSIARGSSSSSSSGAKKPSSGAAGSSSSGNSSYDNYVNSQKAQQAKADRKETKQAKAQVDKLRNQNKSLGAQANSLKIALGSKGFRRALNTGLTNIAGQHGQQSKLLMEGYGDRLTGLKGSALDNEKAAADASFQNTTNRNRERQSAMSEALSQGAGESDILATQAMSLRNWSANQGEVNRSFFDTLRSVNSSLTDLNSDTKTARANIDLEANANREKLWGNFYQQKSETQTQLGNIYGQMGANKSDIKGILGNKETGAYSAKGAKAAGKGANASTKSATRAFNAAAASSGQAWKNPGISQATMNWEGAAPLAGDLNNTKLSRDVAGNEPKRKAPEGARLRNWRD